MLLPRIHSNSLRGRIDAVTQNVFPLFSRDVAVVITQNALCVLEGIATQNALVFPKVE